MLEEKLTAMENQDKNQLNNQENVAPGAELDKSVTDPENLPDTGGTGGNRPVYTSGTVIIKDQEGDEETEESDDEQ